MTTYTEANFDQLSWHDCCVHGIDLLTGDPEEGDGDWTNDLALDIDFITEWACGGDASARFQVAPATLVFHQHVFDTCGGAKFPTPVPA